MHLAARLVQRCVNRLVYLLLDKKIGAVRVEPDAGIERVIPDAFQPLPQRNQVCVRTEESGYDDYTRPISTGNAKSVINR